jgi:broad specificity phosphatase PhoE
MGAKQSVGRSAGTAPIPGTVLDSQRTTDYSLILVRHGVSCANLKKALGQTFVTYTDPELTRAGIVKAIHRGKLFRDYLLNNEHPNPIVGASVLMRAQQTAFLMMSPSYRGGDYLQNLYVVPYVSEVGASWFFPQEDNRPMKPNEKVAVLGKSTPALASHLRYVPASFPADAATPNPAKFVQWLQTNYQTLNGDEPGNSPVVIFTHGNYILEFIKYVMKRYPGRHGDAVSKKDRPNYTAFKFNVRLNALGNIESIVWSNIIPYASEVDQDPDAPYSVTTRIDTRKECEGEGDRCRKSTCSSRLQHVFSRRNENSTASNATNESGGLFVNAKLMERVQSRPGAIDRRSRSVNNFNRAEEDNEFANVSLRNNNARPINGEGAATDDENTLPNEPVNAPSRFGGRRLSRHRSRRHTKKPRVHFSRKIYRRRC